MVHLLLLSIASTIACLTRYYWQRHPDQPWTNRWQQALIRFALPPLLLLTTAIALFWMGPMGQMVNGWQGWLGYAWAIGFLAVGAVFGLQLLTEAFKAIQQIQQYEATQINDRPARLLPIKLPFVAQIGLWQPQLVVSQGLLDQMDKAHLTAVLTHEAAHQHYRDTFWFFWLGWLRRMSLGLPQTEGLWQELLLLRELRADRWAAQQVNPLLLAEALLQVVSAPLQMEFMAAFNPEMAVDRLDERITALLEPTETDDRNIAPFILVAVLVFLPLLSIPFHHQLCAIL
jgi:Zn-dependent protease with chaperone function